MVRRKKLPVGVEFFEQISDGNCYYVDKTGFISELLQNCGKVNLFTRPRRFGKTLNMDMLKSFFEIGCKNELFDGLEISRNEDVVKNYMGKFPVISISLKSVDGFEYVDARNAMSSVIGDEAARFSFLLSSERLDDNEKQDYRRLTERTEATNYADVKSPRYAMSDETMSRGLQTLSGLLEKHYGKKVILLVDEYDVPLDKVYQGGYYDRMTALIRSVLGNVLKTNCSLEFAVLTGCLRISKESIFTGLNNLKVNTITDYRFEKYFGFTDDEVKEMLEYYGMSEKYETVKNWYDGYRFGSTFVYCPWDVINYVDDLMSKSDLPPKNYWANTSGNGIVRLLIDKAGADTKRDIESLIEGKSVEKSIRQELTYSEIDSSIENIWSVLLSTGYLTQTEQVNTLEEDEERYRLVIPNKEIRSVFVNQIWQWFSDSSKNNTDKLDRFCNAFPAGDAAVIENLFGEYLWEMISIRDTARQNRHKESFYHGILLGLLKHRSDWLVKSNVESGEGYSDIVIEVPKGRTGVVIEVKYAEESRLDAACDEALAQAADKRYASYLEDDGMETIVKCAVACYKKRCRVRCE